MFRRRLEFWRFSYKDASKAPDGTLQVDLNEATFIASGEKAFLVAIAQQLLWLTASFRLPRYGQLCYADALLLNTEPGTFLICSIPLQEAIDLGRNLCWWPLLLGSVITRNYPIPARQQERGLELPFHLMITLAGPLKPRLLDGGIYLQGYLRLLFLTASSKLGSIQWHLVAQEDHRDQLHEELIQDYEWLVIRDLEDLANRCTFLGHYRSVVMDLGTEKPVQYCKDIRPANADDESQRPKLPPPSVTWGISGGVVFTAHANLQLVYSKALALAIDGSGQRFLDILNLAVAKPVILYDDDSKNERGWMVPWLLVMLHMVHTWAARCGTVDRGVPHTQPICNSAQQAKRLVGENRSFVLRDGDGECESDKKTMEDLLQEYWQAMIQREGENLRPLKEDTRGVELSQSQLHGWDYMDIVLDDHACRR